MFDLGRYLSGVFRGRLGGGVPVHMFLSFGWIVVFLRLFVVRLGFLAVQVAGWFRFASSVDVLSFDRLGATSADRFLVICSSLGACSWLCGIEFCKDLAGLSSLMVVLSFGYGMWGRVGMCCSWWWRNAPF